MNKDHLKILAFTNGTASHIWRFDPVARRLNERTEHEMAVTTYDQWNNDTIGANIVIMEMLSSHSMVETCKNMGAKVIYEADDAVLDTYGRERKNLMHVDENFRASAIETIRKCDALTVTTPELKESYARYTDAPIFVLPIYMDYQYYGDVIATDPPERNTDEIRIGWFGSKGHLEDLKMILPALRRVMEKNKKIKLVYSGFGGMGSENPVMDIMWGEDVFKEIPRERREFYQMANEEYWKYRHRFMDIDIGLAPLIDDEFNRAKCPTKWLEYSVLQTPTVASPTVYGNVIANGKTGLIAKTEDEWFNHIMALANDEKLRNKIAMGASEEVRDKHNVEDHWKDWQTVYETVYA
jgi:glycosyltransferase involved in cell wall biosynthesis